MGGAILFSVWPVKSCAGSCARISAIFIPQKSLRQNLAPKGAIEILARESRKSLAEQVSCKK